VNGEELERERVVICLLTGDTRTEVPIERVERLIQRPEVIRVPGAPHEVKGILEFEGQLIAAYCMDDRGNMTPACAAVVRREDGTLAAVLAEEIAGGGRIDQIYG